MGAVLSLDPEDRFWHFVARIAGGASLWGLRSDEGWLMPLSPEGFEYLPLWPHRRYAQTIADLHHTGQTATEITLDDFRAEWAGALAETGVQVGVFPDTDGAFWPSDAQALLDTIEDEAQNPF